MKRRTAFHRGGPVSAPVGREVGRFTAVGFLNAGLTFAVFTVLLKVLHLNYLVALWTCWFCGMVMSYCLNFIWVFDQPDRLAFDHRFAKFAVTGLLSITLNLLALRVVVGQTGGDPFWLQIALMPPVIGFNFLAAKFWSLAPSRS